jgi:hypothetical protein
MGHGHRHAFVVFVDCDPALMHGPLGGELSKELYGGSSRLKVFAFPPLLAGRSEEGRFLHDADILCKHFQLRSIWKPPGVDLP